MHLKKVTLHPEKYPAADQYPFNLRLLQETNSLSFTSAVTFFIGENGSGKSTLLEAITRKCGIIMWQGVTRPRYKASPYEKELYKTIDYERTGHYRIYKDFMADPQKYTSANRKIKKEI